MTAERANLESRLKAAMARKKAAKGADDATFVDASLEVLALLKEIAHLPEDGKLTDFEMGTYCWALYAVATRSRDPIKCREYTVRFVKAVRRVIDSPQFWGDERAKEFGRTLFNSMITSLDKAVKDSSPDAAEAMLRKVAVDFMETLSMRDNAFLDDAGFRREPVTDEQRAAMVRNNGGKPIRMRAWPSVAEKAFGLLNRCLKADVALRPPVELVDFLLANVSKGEWLGLYCASALMRVDRNEEARKLLVRIARKRPDEFWVWTHLAESFVNSAQDAMSCLCRALTCRIQDPEIAKAVKAKVHRQLARMMAAIGDTAASARETGYAGGADVVAEDIARYAQGAKSANRLVFASDSPLAATRRVMSSRTAGDGNRAVKFSGTLMKVAGKNFGFVNCMGVGTVFVPPRFAERMNNNEKIAGMAERKEDKKKNRMSWCMISAL